MKKTDFFVSVSTSLSHSHREMVNEKNSFGSCTTNREEKAGAVELMDEYWFFHSMFDKSRMFRSSVDASWSNTSRQAVASDPPESVFSNPNHPRGEVSSHNLVRTPSPPPPIESEETTQGREIHDQLSWSNIQGSCSSLSDVSSVPSLGDRLDSYKMEKPSIARQRSRQELNVVSPGKENEKHLYRARQLKCRTPYKSKSWKSVSDLEFEEMKGFMDLGFIFNREDMDPSVVSMIPGLRDKRLTKNANVKRPYLSEAWFVERYDPPNFNWVDRKSGVDMKERLRVWARAVAFNVRREC